MNAQTCKRCGRIQYVVWIVNDNLWKKFCQQTGWDENKTICLECFAELIGYVDLGDISEHVKFFNIYKNYCSEKMSVNVFTGLYDKNGRALYSNDVVIAQKNKKAIIKLEYGCFYVIFDDKRKIRLSEYITDKNRTNLIKIIK